MKMRLSKKKLKEILDNGHAKIRNSATVPTSNMESVALGQQMAEKEDTRFSSPVNITVHSYRKRFCDADGVSAKAAIDGIVKAGVLVDDSPLYVKEVRYRQTKIKNPQEEKTIITLEEDEST